MGNSAIKFEVMERIENILLHFWTLTTWASLQISSNRKLPNPFKTFAYTNKNSVRKSGENV